MDGWMALALRRRQWKRVEQYSFLVTSRSLDENVLISPFKRIYSRKRANFKWFPFSKEYSDQSEVKRDSQTSSMATSRSAHLLMATASTMKVMIFRRGDKKYWYKFLPNISENVIDSTLRREFAIAGNARWYCFGYPVPFWSWQWIKHYCPTPRTGTIKNAEFERSSVTNLFVNRHDFDL